MGQQTLPFLFLITGWADGYLRFGRENEHLQTVTSQNLTPQPSFRFKRVLSSQYNGQFFNFFNQICSLQILNEFVH
jgi:hypothetical protein